MNQNTEHQDHLAVTLLQYLMEHRHGIPISFSMTNLPAQDQSLQWGSNDGTVAFERALELEWLAPVPNTNTYAFTPKWFAFQSEIPARDHEDE